MTAIPFQREIVYPESDGQPMAESDLHRKEMTYLIEALTEHFRRADDIYVAGNLFFYVFLAVILCWLTFVAAHALSLARELA